ncbi:hypothetical protein [Pseudomonas sp.]|uniref:hypothetical protein n=1 Tax=Pseudomonas sp. TaxID=306 RepID=UPI002C8E2453|nr:hypothetical protein [Pseudomonas sp.]HUE91870.1 hypothetical protein [Pseudomonas sp.]
MNDDVMRLSDLVPEYARRYKVSLSDAAYELHELFIELNTDHHLKQPFKAIPDQVVWVGRVGSPTRTAKPYKLYFSTLAEYLNDFIDSNCNSESKFVRCLYAGEHIDAKDIPSGIIYLSKSALGEWILDAGIELPEFILSSSAGERSEKDKSGSGFKEQELGTISKIMSGLVELIKEVDKAHREPPTDYDGKKRADKIKTHASRLNNPPRKKFDVYSALISFAEDAGVDIPTDHQTLRKYMRAQSKPNNGA